LCDFVVVFLGVFCINSEQSVRDLQFDIAANSDLNERKIVSTTAMAAAMWVTVAEPRSKSFQSQGSLQDKHSTMVVEELDQVSEVSMASDKVLPLAD
jgi:hypothetical protein